MPVSGRADNRELLLERLREVANYDPETGHLEADRALLDYIGDPEVTALFDAMDKWYA